MFHSWCFSLSFYKQIRYHDGMQWWRLSERSGLECSVHHDQSLVFWAIQKNSWESCSWNILPRWVFAQSVAKNRGVWGCQEVGKQVTIVCFGGTKIEEKRLIMQPISFFSKKTFSTSNSDRKILLVLSIRLSIKVKQGLCLPYINTPELETLFNRVEMTLITRAQSLLSRSNLAD